MKPAVGGSPASASIEIVLGEVVIRAGRDADVLAPGFRIVGLGQLVEAIAGADRLVTFG